MKEQWELFTWILKSGVKKTLKQWPMCKILLAPVTFWWIYKIPCLFLPWICLSVISQKFKEALNLMHSTEGFVCFLLFQQANSSWLVGFLPFPLSDSLTDSCAGSVWSKKAITQHITIPQSRWEIMPHTCTLSNSFTLAFFKLNYVILVYKSLWTSWWSL